jgi:hypothetical protein
MSLLFATAILAAGGLGLYMYKGIEYDEKGYDEDILFNTKDEDDEELKELEEIYEEPKARSRGNKTKRSRKTGGTKRRY